METKWSVRAKVAQMQHDMSCAAGSDFISKEFVSEKEGQVLKEAPVYIMH